MRNRNLSKAVPALEFCFFGNSQKCVLWSVNFWGLIPTVSSVFSSEKSYPPSRLMCCQETAEPLTTASRNASREVVVSKKTGATQSEGRRAHRARRCRASESRGARFSRNGAVDRTRSTHSVRMIKEQVGTVSETWLAIHKLRRRQGRGRHEEAGETNAARIYVEIVGARPLESCLWANRQDRHFPLAIGPRVLDEPWAAVRVTMHALPLLGLGK
jgi:hypothetical protein